MTANIELMFWLFLAVGVMLLIGILLLVSTLISIAKINSPNKPKDPETKNETNKKIALLIPFLSVLSCELFAAASDVSEPLISISKQDVWILIAIDLALLFVLVYLKNNLSKYMAQIYGPLPVKAKKHKSALSTFISDAVPIEKEASILMDHNYDGIRELDNNLPPWWKWGFYISIIFAFLYLGYYHALSLGDLQLDEYKNELVEAELALVEFNKTASLKVDEHSVIRLVDESNLLAGKKIFMRYCKACHLEQGQGQVGPNFTDDYWIYGNGIKNIFKTIKYGATRGMKSWTKELNPLQMQQVASYIKSLHGTNPPNPKEPEGDLYEFDQDLVPADSVQTPSIPNEVQSL